MVGRVRADFPAVLSCKRRSSSGAMRCSARTCLTNPVALPPWAWMSGSRLRQPCAPTVVRILWRAKLPRSSAACPGRHPSGHQHQSQHPCNRIVHFCNRPPNIMSINILANEDFPLEIANRLSRCIRSPAPSSAPARTAAPDVRSLALQGDHPVVAVPTGRGNEILYCSGSPSVGITTMML